MAPEFARSALEKAPLTWDRIEVRGPGGIMSYVELSSPQLVVGRAAVRVDCLAAGTYCGASMNPARSLGPAVFAGGEALGHLWLYVCATVVGAVAAALAYRWVRREKAAGEAVQEGA